MSELLTTGCVLACSFGMAPAPFMALEIPGKPMLDGVLAAATIEEIAPGVNILPFVMCESPENPEVAAATAAAMGVLVPMPCLPVVVTPWMPPVPNMGFGGIPLASAASRCLCAWGGMIAVEAPVAFEVNTLV